MKEHDLMNGSPDARKAWPEAAAAAKHLQKSLVELRLDPAGTVEAAATELKSGSRQAGLTILRVLGVDATKELLAPLLRVALATADTHIVRELLGRLPYRDAERLIPPAVWQLLDEEDDYDAYRRMAELLVHLGLNDALAELCRRANDHSDPDVREVADDYAGP